MKHTLFVCVCVCATCMFVFFFSDKIMADVASKQQRDSLVFIHHSNTHKKTHRTDKPDGKPVLCQRTFSSVFPTVFFLHN